MYNALRDYKTYHFSGSHKMIDEIHALFERWDSKQPFDPPIEPSLLHTVKLAVHEWLANLVQHASFNGNQPQVSLAFRPNGSHLHCVIEDNSEGFDLDGQLSARPEILDAFPERGMGLLMIKACTEHLVYSECAQGSHRLEFSVSADHDPWLNIPF